MTITISSTGITLDSDNFTGTDQSQKLTLTYNCGTAYDQLTLTNNANAKTLTPTSFGLTTFKNGPYLFELEVTTQAGSVLKESKCVVLLEDVLCGMLSDYGDSTKLGKVLTFEALNNFINCNTCGCSIACTLYDSFTTTTNNDNDCGC